MDTILAHGVEMAIKKVILRMKALLGDSVIDSGGLGSKSSVGLEGHESQNCQGALS